MQQDPEIIEALAKIINLDDKPTPPPLFGWTPIIDWLTRISNQLIANRPNTDPSKVTFYPQPVIPAVAHRKRSELSEIDNDILTSQQRYVERTSAVKQLNS